MKFSSVHEYVRMVCSTSWGQGNFSPLLIFFFHKLTEIRVVGGVRDGGHGGRERSALVSRAHSLLVSDGAGTTHASTENTSDVFDLSTCPSSSLLTPSISAWGTPGLRDAAVLPFSQGSDAFCPVAMIISLPPSAWRTVTNNYITVGATLFNPTFNQSLNL